MSQEPGRPSTNIKHLGAGVINVALKFAHETGLEFPVDFRYIWALRLDVSGKVAVESYGHKI